MGKKFDLIDGFRQRVESDGGSFSLTEMEVEELFDVVRRMNSYAANIGFYPERTEHNPREKAFSEHWMKQNEPRKGINHGHGTLQDLFIVSSGFFKTEVKHVVTDKERMIVATVIQWLGSNCGMCFLEEVLKKMGKRVVDEDRLAGMVTEHELNRSNREWTAIVDRFKDRLAKTSKGLAKIVAICHTRTGNKMKEQVLKLATELLNTKEEQNATRKERV